MTTRIAALCLFAAGAAGCQIIAPLPGAGGEGGSPPSLDGGEIDEGEGETSQGTEVTPPPEETGPCEVAACSTHCARSMDACELTPQYPSVETCCAACEGMPSPAEYAACRAVGSGDPAGCTASGLLGPADADGCIGRCEASCTLYTALCPDTLALTSLEGCMLLCLAAEAPPIFNACKPFKEEGSFACRLQLIYSALEETDDGKRNQTCRDIVQGRCPKPECEADDDDD
ncbi:hypothetical protein [Sorangium sp. So ce233]|uniref:hypothetical protein n=1 Tax=Sorangium sp. So ce233 TaxID=3133290 RepID=UPI003F63AB87